MLGNSFLGAYFCYNGHLFSSLNNDSFSQLVKNCGTSLKIVKMETKTPDPINKATNDEMTIVLKSLFSHVYDVLLLALNSGYNSI